MYALTGHAVLWEKCCAEAGGVGHVVASGLVLRSTLEECLFPNAALPQQGQAACMLPAGPSSLHIEGCGRFEPAANLDVQAAWPCW